MRIVFMGTPEFSVTVLKNLADAGHEIVAVYSQPPRKSGRGLKLRISPVHACANERKFPVYCPINFRDMTDVDAFESHQADVAVVVAYGLILPQTLLEMPRFGCLNIHASLLPRWRGAAPIHRAIMSGDTETGVCILQMDSGLDTGAVRLQRVLKIGSTETTLQLHNRLAPLGAQAVLDVLADLDEYPPIGQPSAGMSYAEKIDKSEARINWTRSAMDIDRQIRALSPFPGAWCMLQGERVKILASELASGEGMPGTILDSNLRISCGRGAVKVLRLQLAGKKPQDAEAFVRSFGVLGRLD